MWQVRRLAVIKLGALGDVAKTIPTVRAIRRAYPHIRIAWVVRKVWADLLVGSPDVDELIVVDRSARSIASGALALRRFCPEVLLDMQGLFVSGLIARASGAQHRFTWSSGRELSGVLTGSPVVPAPPTMNAVECLFGFARLLGVEQKSNEVPAYLVNDTESANRVRELLGLRPTLETPENRRAEQQLVGMHVGASEPNKRWLHERWAELAVRLAERGHPVALMGGPSDVVSGTRVEEIAGAGVRSIVGRTTVRELAAAIVQCAVFVGGDTGATHVATLVGTPTVCLMGATDPAQTGPYGAQHRVVYHRLDCSPCYRHPTCSGRFDCMQSITCDEVLRACVTMLGE